MAKRISNESHVKDVLSHIINKNKLEPGLNQVSVIEAWKNLMGNGVNNYTHSVSLRRGTLFVELTSSVLREELSYGKQKIIDMLNEELGKVIIKKLILKVY